MKFVITICKEVLVNADDDFPIGNVEDMTKEQIDYIWDTVENNHYQIDEELVKVC